MITDTIIEWWGNVVSFVVGLIEFPEPPEFISQLGGYIATMTSWTAGTDAWIPWPLMVVGVTAVAACLAAAVGVKLVRVVLSFFTAGGGSAA